jgi:hypothetical protein
VEKVESVSLFEHLRADEIARVASRFAGAGRVATNKKKGATNTKAEAADPLGTGCRRHMLGGDARRYTGASSIAGAVSPLT